MLTLHLDDIPGAGSDVRVILSTRLNAALAASVYDDRPCYLDDTGERGPLGHVGLGFIPYFRALEQSPTSSPFPAVQAWVDLQLPSVFELDRVIHAVGGVEGVGQLGSGAGFIRRFTMSWEGGPEFVLRAAVLVPEARFYEAPSEVGPSWDWRGNVAPAWTETLVIRRGDPNVFAECAGTFNSIHLERSAALSAGLPERPYQGIAMLLRATARIVDRQLEANPSGIRRLAGLFRRPIFAGDTVRLTCFPGAASGSNRTTFEFEVRNAAGQLLVQRGILEVERSN